MKKCLLWMALLVVGATLQTCKNDADPVALQKVQFTFKLPDDSPSGGRTQAVHPAALLLSLENSEGEVVFTFKKIMLVQVGDDMITETITLSPGTYTITDFWLVDETNEGIYATPKTGSPLAGAVSHPLPYSFTVTSDDISIVAMEVVSVSHHAPEDFGYVSFTIHAMNPLRVAVFTNAGDELAFTTASATMVHINSFDGANENVGNYALEAKTNLISFPGEPTDNYRLTVSKPGFKTYTKDFVYTELLDSLQGAPFQIVLHQFTLQVFVSDLSIPLSFRLDVMGDASVQVHWGDNTSTSEPTFGNFEHTYTSTGHFVVTVTGDIESITAFDIAYSQPTLEAIDVQALTNLQSFHSVLAPGPATIDLSKNTQLVEVSLMDNRWVKHLILPRPNHILGAKQVTYLLLDGAVSLSAAEMDAIILDLYNINAPWGTQNGRFAFDKSIFYSGEMIGPPSNFSLEMLRWLKSAGWDIRPDPGP